MQAKEPIKAELSEYRGFMEKREMQTKVRIDPYMNQYIITICNYI